LSPEKIPEKGLAGRPGLRLHGRVPGGPCVAIERVEITRADGPPEPDAKEALERLLVKWLVRAYLRKYASDDAPRALPKEEVA